MTFYPSSELLLDPSPFRVDNTLGGQLAKGAARGAAAARRSDPRPFAGRPRSGAGGFAMSLALEAWDLFTAEPQPAPITGLALPPLPPGATFRIEGTATYKDNLIPPGVTASTPIGPIDVIAPLGNIEIRQGFAGQAVYVTEAVGTPQQSERLLSFGTNGTRYTYVRIDSVTVIPVSGAPIEVPGILPFPNSSTEPNYPENIPITVLIPRVIGRTPQPLSVPMVIPRPSDLGRRPVPILYPAGLTPNQRRALPQMWITPEGIQVGRGYADDRVTSAPDTTIDIDLDLELLTDYQRREPSVSVVCTADPAPPSDCCSCTEIRAIVIEELDSKFPPSRPSSEVTFVSAAQASGEFTLPQFSTWMKLEIVQPPNPGKSQYGGGQAPDIEYVGWYSIGARGVSGERIPMNYSEISVPLPPKTTGVSFTIVRNGTARLTVGYTLPT